VFPGELAQLPHFSLRSVGIDVPAEVPQAVAPFVPWPRTQPSLCLPKSAAASRVQSNHDLHVRICEESPESAVADAPEQHYAAAIPQNGAVEANAQCCATKRYEACVGLGLWSVTQEPAEPCAGLCDARCSPETLGVCLQLPRPPFPGPRQIWCQTAVARAGDA
jgi:hypothetical protein